MFKSKIFVFFSIFIIFFSNFIPSAFAETIYYLDLVNPTVTQNTSSEVTLSSLSEDLNQQISTPTMKDLGLTGKGVKVGILSTGISNSLNYDIFSHYDCTKSSCL
jgi:hypothetical protein